MQFNTPLGIEIGTFAAVALFVLVIARRVEVGASVRRRLRGEAKAEPRGRKRAPTTSIVRPRDLRNPALAWVQRTTFQDPKERTKLRRDLIAAGFDLPSAPAIYVVVRFLFAIGLPTAYVFSKVLGGKPQSGLMFILLPFGLAILGMMVPRAFIDNRAGARRTQIENEFPDSLDLMVVCVEFRARSGRRGAARRPGDREVSPANFHAVPTGIGRDASGTHASRSAAPYGRPCECADDQRVRGPHDLDRRSWRIDRPKPQDVLVGNALPPHAEGRGKGYAPAGAAHDPACGVHSAGDLRRGIAPGRYRRDSQCHAGDEGVGLVNLCIRTLVMAICSGLLIGLAGCEHVPRFLAWLTPAPKMKVIPLPADLGHVGPQVLEDRLYARAAKAIEDRDYAMALDALQTAQEARPNDPRVLTAMGVVYDKLGRFDLSNRYYDLAEAADPGSKIVATDRRYSLLLQQRGLGNDAGAAVMLASTGGAPGPAEAVEALRPAPPPTPDQLYARAVVAIQQREYTQALALLGGGEDNAGQRSSRTQCNGCRL